MEMRDLNQMNSTSSAASNSRAPSTTSERLKLDSNNITWEYGVEVTPGNSQVLRCILCSKQIHGDVYRLKQHIAAAPGNVSKCPKATKEDRDKCFNDLNKAKIKKAAKRKHEDELRSEVDINVIDEEDDEELLGSRKNPQYLGPMDRFANNINSKNIADGRQSNLNETIFKERTENVHQLLARWVYETAVPFNVIDSDTFLKFCEAVAQFGPGYRPPSQYQLREPLLKKEKERTQKLLKKHEEEWKINVCSILTDAWSDKKRQGVMNLCVNCKEGTTFVSSKEDSASAHTGEYIFDYVDRFIDDIGQEHVIQVVTDNAANNMAMAGLLKAKRPTVFWTSCATHTINLILEGIGKQPKFKATIEKAKALTIFVYAHHQTLHLMRTFTQKGTLLDPELLDLLHLFLLCKVSLKRKKK